MSNKKTNEQIKEEQQREVAEAALQANRDIQEAAHGGYLKAATQDGHLIPWSSSLGAGGTAFEDTNQIRSIKNIREADKAYREVGIIRNVIDIMTDFTSEGLKVHHPVLGQERFYRAWLNKTNMDEIAKMTLRGLYKWSNIGIFKFWGKIRPKTRQEMMSKAKELFNQGKDKEAVKAFFRDDTSVKAGRIPVRYSCLPPFRIRITGSILFDTRYYTYSIPENDRLKIANPAKHANPLEQKLLKEIPDSLKMRIEKDGQVILSDENFTMLHYKRDCARLWADPIILPIMNDLRYKQVLRRLDISVAESIINPITIFKLGKTVEGFAPNKEQFQNLANLLKTPVATKTLVWSDLIEIEQVTSDATEVFSIEKYKEVDSDILAGLGVSQILINGDAGGSSSNAFLSVRTLLERLEDGRQEFMKFLNAELALVRKAMGWKIAPTITWDQMSLRDEAAEKRIVIELLDRKIISAESALDALGYDSTIEMARKVRELKSSEKTGVPASVGPFEEQVRVQSNSDPARLNIDIQKDALVQNEKFKTEELSIKKKEPTNTGAPKSGPGRPGQKGDPSSRKQKVQRDTKPKGMGELLLDSADPMLIDVALSSRSVIEHYLKPKFLESVEKENLRQLNKEEKATYNKMIEVLWSCTHPHSEQPISREFVAFTADEVARGCEQLDTLEDGTTVRSLYEEMVSQYRQINHKFPTETVARDLFARALVIFRENF